MNTITLFTWQKNIPILLILFSLLILVYSSSSCSIEIEIAHTHPISPLKSLTRQSRNDYFFRQKDRLAKGELGPVEAVVNRNLLKLNQKFKQCRGQAKCLKKASRKCTSLLAQVGEYYLRAGFYDFAEIYADAAYSVLSKRILGKAIDAQNHICLPNGVGIGKNIFSVIGISAGTSLTSTLSELGKEEDIQAIINTMNPAALASFKANGLIQKREFKKAKDNLINNGNSGFIQALASGGQSNPRKGNSGRVPAFFGKIEHGISQELIARLDYVLGNYPDVIQYGSNERYLLARALLKTRTDDSKLQQLVDQAPDLGDTPETKLLAQLEHKMLQVELSMAFGNIQQANSQLSALIEDYIRAYKVIKTNSGALQLAEHPLFRSREIPLMHNIMRTGHNLLNQRNTDDLAEKMFALAQTRAAYSTTTAIENFAQRKQAKSKETVEVLRNYQDKQRIVREDMKAYRYQMLYGKKDQAQESLIKLKKDQAELKNLSSKIQKNKGEINKIKAGTFVPINNIQKQLGDDEALIAYVLLDELAIHPNLNIFDLPDSKSYAWVITKKTKQLVVLDTIPSEVKHLKESILDNIRLGKRVINTDSSYVLYQGVFEPLEKYLQGKTNISVITDGSLDGIPLQILLRERLENNVKNFKHAPFLIREYTFSYSPSINAFDTLRANGDNKINLTTYLGIGNPMLGKENVAYSRGYASSVVYYPDDNVNISAINDELPSLSESAIEMENMSKLFLAQNVTELALENATEASINKLSDTERYKLILFSTHGLLAGEYSLHEPALVLTPPLSISSSSNNGVLTSSEVAKLNLKADLVILSACNTGSGNNIDVSSFYVNKPVSKYYKPGAKPLEGLANAFFYAGTKSLLVTHWTVPDVESSRLTVDIVKRLKTSETKVTLAKAVQQAQLAILDSNSEASTHPKNWAGFVVVGNGLLTN